MRILVAVALAALVALAGCASPVEVAQEESAAIPPPPRTLTVLVTDDHFVGKDVIEAFEAAHRARVHLVPVGSAEDVLAAALDPKAGADVAYGLDVTLRERVLASGVFVTHKPAAAAAVKPAYVFDESWHLTPVDYRFVTLNFDEETLEARGLAPPARLRDLADPAWNASLVVPDPATTQEGLAFLLATVATFGDRGAFTYEDWWRNLTANGLLVAEDWPQSYFGAFAGGGFEGTRPLAIGTSTLPAYAVREACTEGGRYLGLAACPAGRSAIRVGNVAAPGAAWLHVRGMGVLASSSSPDLARAFVDFALTRAYQESASFHMLTLPVTVDAVVPDFLALLPEPADYAVMSTDRVTESKITAWLAGFERATRGDGAVTP